jgi:hypothetical protein
LKTKWADPNAGHPVLHHCVNKHLTLAQVAPTGVRLVLKNHHRFLLHTHDSAKPGREKERILDSYFLINNISV